MRTFLTLALSALLMLVATSCAPMDYTRDIYGYLEGQVMLGPICPVERFDTPCPVSPEAYAAREILISQGQEILARAKLDAQGRYWIALMPGRYRVDINRVGMDRSSDVPKAIDIARGKTLRLDIEIDTGIR